MLDLDKRSIMYLPASARKGRRYCRRKPVFLRMKISCSTFPYKYIDRSRFYKVAEVTGDMPYIQMKGRVLFF